MSRREKIRLKELKRILEETKNNPRYIELKRKKELNELTFEETKELTELYQQHTRLLNEQTSLYWSQTDKNFTVALIIQGISIVVFVVALIIRMFF